MGNYELLKAAINDVIKANGRQEITGEVLNQVLLSMVNSLGAGYQCMGVATPSTNPSNPDQNVFYFATQAGTYTNFDAIVLQAGISVLIWNGAWTSQTWFTVDSTPTNNSQNLIASGAVFNALKLDGGAYDVSAHNSGATFASLSALLNSANLATLIPTEIRHGGMSIKFVQSSDNKYVQYRLMSDSFNTTVTNWQKVDNGLFNRYWTTTSKDLNDIIDSGLYNLISNSTNLPSDAPTNSTFLLEVSKNYYTSNNTYYLINQLLICLESSKIYIRRYTYMGDSSQYTGWSDWVNLNTTDLSTSVISKYWTVSTKDLNTIVDNGCYNITGTATNAPSLDRNENYLLLVVKNPLDYNSSYYTINQIIFGNSTQEIYSRRYLYMGDKSQYTRWYDWISLNKTYDLSNYLDGKYWATNQKNLNNIIQTGCYNIIGNCTNLPANIPSNADYLLVVVKTIYEQNPDWYVISQLLFSQSSDDIYSRRYVYMGDGSQYTKWNNWISLNSSRKVINITNGNDFISEMERAFTIGNCDVNISIGTLDLSSLAEQYYNDDQYGMFGRFCMIGNGCKYNFSSNTKIICNYTGDNLTLMRNFSIFNTDTHNFEINGLIAEGSKLRYIIHDDPSNKDNVNGYTHVYNNCQLTLDNSNVPNVSANNNFYHTIGGGIGSNSTIIINGGIYHSESNGHETGVSVNEFCFHGYKYSYDYLSRVIVSGVWLYHTLTTGKIAGQENYGEIELVVNNCSMGEDILNGTTYTATVVKWNNEIRGYNS